MSVIIATAYSLTQKTEQGRKHPRSSYNLLTLKKSRITKVYFFTELPSPAGVQMIRPVAQFLDLFKTPWHTPCAAATPCLLFPADVLTKFAIFETGKCFLSNSTNLENPYCNCFPAIIPMLSQLLLFKSQLHQHRPKGQMQLYATKRSYSYWYKLLKCNRKFKCRTK